jgi:spore germination protein (amino acid permease)
MPISKITSKQYIFAIYKTQIGVGILSLPRELAQSSGAAGLLSLVLSWVMMVSISFFIVRAMSLHPGATFQQAIVRVFGKLVGGCLNMLWAVFALLAAATVLMSMLFILQVWIISDVPVFELALVFLIPVYMICRYREQAIGRYAEFVYLVTLWLYPLLFYPLKDASLLNLLPILPDGIGPVLHSVRMAIFAFLGLEIAMFLYPNLEKPRRAFRDLVVANTLTTSLYLIVACITYFFFDRDQLQQHLWPTLELFKTVKFPFIERFEIVFLSFYTIIITYTIMSYVFASVRSASSVIARIDHLWILRAVCLSILAISLVYPPDYEAVQAASRMLTQAGYAVFAFPLFFYACSLLRVRLIRKGAAT